MELRKMRQEEYTRGGRGVFDRINKIKWIGEE
jgi:hypothetical protein